MLQNENFLLIILGELGTLATYPYIQATRFHKKERNLRLVNNWTVFLSKERQLTSLGTKNGVPKLHELRQSNATASQPHCQHLYHFDTISCSLSKNNLEMGSYSPPMMLVVVSRSVPNITRCRGMQKRKANLILLVSRHPSAWRFCKGVDDQVEARGTLPAQKKTTSLHS
jgi:hypothetical protein